VCLKQQRIKHQPLKNTELSRGPWNEIGSDLFEFEGKQYLLMVDYFSRWIELFEIKEMTSRSVITKMKNAFSRFGVPEKVRTDNGGCYNSNQFCEFAKSYGFAHSTSSPRYPESNGLAERCVQTVKNMWKKSDDFYMSLMVYKATPLESGFTPAELMLGRNIRTGLPQLVMEKKEVFRERDKQLKARQKQNFDRRTGAKGMAPLHLRDRVWVKTRNEEGSEGRVVQEAQEPDSYIVERDDKLIRRNRKHLTFLPRDSPSALESEIENTSVDEVNNSDHLTITRSGRISRPNPKYNDYVK